jgi:hypothetical protein
MIQLINIIVRMTFDEINLLKSRRPEDSEKQPRSGEEREDFLPLFLRFLMVVF